MHFTSLNTLFNNTQIIMASSHYHKRDKKTILVSVQGHTFYSLYYIYTKELETTKNKQTWAKVTVPKLTTN